MTKYTAHVASTTNGFAVVTCPYCGDLHAHRREVIGSREVLAHCADVGQLLTYAVGTTSAA